MTDVPPPPEPTTDSGSMILFEAIARKQQVSATYNGMQMQLAPHVLYTRDEKLYLGGIVTIRRGVPVTQVKLSIFKVEGLRELALLTAVFAIDRDFDPSDVRYAGSTIFVVER